MNKANAPVLSVIVPTAGKRERLVLALHALIAQSLPADRFETIVVLDAAEDDGSLEAIAAAEAAGLRVSTLLAGGLGQAAAQNRGAAAARGDVLLFMDDDVLLSPTYLATCNARVAQAPDTVCRAPVYLLRYLAAFRDPERGLRYDGRPDGGSLLAGRTISRAMVLSDWPAIARQCRHRNRFERLVSDCLGAAPQRHPWLGYSGSGVALQRSLFEAAGGYDEAFGRRWGCEAIELGYRLWRRGARFRELPGILSAHMDHPRGASLTSFADSFDYFAAKHGDLAIREVQALIAGPSLLPPVMAAPSA
ncbi:glycosyltransferase family 2 protein [Mangrovicella endophytica]|uniref:glycosyltransferase family 2 protein n=1 Tax=Mangrovicella endophytica TaxID=2066697 RepID=UPI000C9E1371|nr:glycosyltransferase family 2 protein [Mangrovicella endophytica]